MSTGLNVVAGCWAGQGTVFMYCLAVEKHSMFAAENGRPFNKKVVGGIRDREPFVWVDTCCVERDWKIRPGFPFRLGLDIFWGWAPLGLAAVIIHFGFRSGLCSAFPPGM